MSTTAREANLYERVRRLLVAPAVGAEVRLRDGLRYGVLVFVAVWVGWAVLALIGVTIVPANSSLGVPGLDAPAITGGWHNLLTAGDHSDALWYQRIAASGYRTDDASAAFFPLYPIAIMLVALLPGVSILAAAIVVAQGCFLASLVVFHALSLREFGPGVAGRATRYLAIFPTAFFFLVPYTEAPFLLLVLLAFWYARRQSWWLAVLPAALAGLTRSAGVVLVPALAAEALWRWRSGGRNPLPGLAAAAAPLLGLAAYGGYWLLSAGDPMAPLTAQRTWQRSFDLPLHTLLRAVQLAWQYRSYWLIDLIVVGIVLAATVLGGRLLSPGYLGYALASLLMPLCDPYPARPLMSMPRFVLVVFPAFWVIAVAVERRKLPDGAVTAVFAGGYVLLGLLYLNSYSIF
jgi:mannosyltransferase PIG-V